MRVKMPDRKPIITFALIGFTSVVFLIQFLIQTITGDDLLFFYGGKINELILIGQVWRLITPVLLHGSILHLGMNMYGLYILGRGLEMYYGHGRFLLLYLL
jgi:rhomboid protease GluP